SGKSEIANARSKIRDQDLKSAIRNLKSAMRGDTHENCERNGYYWSFVSTPTHVRRSRGCYRSGCHAKRLHGWSKVQPPHGREPAGVQGTGCARCPGKWRVEKGTAERNNSPRQVVGGVS